MASKRNRQDQATNGVKKAKYQAAVRFESSVELKSIDLQNLVEAIDTPRSRAPDTTLKVVDLLLKKNLALMLEKKRLLEKREDRLRACMSTNTETLWFLHTIEKVCASQEGLLSDVQGLFLPDWRFSEIDLEVFKFFIEKKDNIEGVWSTAGKLLAGIFVDVLADLPQAEGLKRLQHYNEKHIEWAQKYLKDQESQAVGIFDYEALAINKELMMEALNTQFD
jgi:hypothetical protein